MIMMMTLTTTACFHPVSTLVIFMTIVTVFALAIVIVIVIVIEMILEIVIVMATSNNITKK